MNKPDLVPIWVIWVVNCIYYTATNFMPVIYCIYCIYLVDYFENALKKRKRMTVMMLVIPMALSFIHIVLSPLLSEKGIFYIDASGHCVRGGFWFYVCCIIAAYYVLFSFHFLKRYKKRLNRDKKRLIVVYISVCLLSVLIQMFVPHLLFQCFIISLATLLFEIQIQHPEEVCDQTTGLLNQVAFTRTADRFKASEIKYTCIGVILDDTVFLSETFGLKQLNGFLTEIADLLKLQFSQDFVFHLGQGRFAIIVKNTNKWDIQKMVAKIQTDFMHPWKYNSIELKLYVRLCVVKVPEEAARTEDVIDVITLVAENERYKKSVVYAKDIDVEYKRRAVYVEHALRSGLFKNRFEVHYQPIYSTKEKCFIGAEALVRLKDDEGQFISPDIFIPIAEKTGTILRIGEFVFESVCKTLSEIVPANYGIKKIDINLSVAQCMQEILADQIISIRSMYRVPPAIVNLEITETAMAHTPEILLRNMKRLSEAGIELSLDDYGSGYSNMNYMLSLPFKMVKIDKEIVWKAEKEERAKKALRSTISMISELNMTVLAEGVETEEQAAWLTEMGCDYLQGFYYSKPVPKNEFLELMKKSNNK